MLFTEATEPIAINELATRAEVAQSTASREVARLVEHGILRTTSVGRNTLVSANWSLPWAKDLKSILVQTIGIIGQLGQALSTVDGIEAAYVYGSWAARHAGEPGPSPNDIDVAIVGTGRVTVNQISVTSSDTAPSRFSTPDRESCWP